MISKYKEFKSELLLEKVNESIIYYSPKLRKILSKMDDNDIAKSLLDIECTEIKPDITMVDLDQDKEDYLTFSTMKNVLKIINELGYDNVSYISKEESDEPWDNKSRRKNLVDLFYNHAYLSSIFKKSRNPIRIGKLVNKVLNNKYSQSEVEDFVNKLKAKGNPVGDFKIVSGEEIAYWYKAENYLEIKGNLGNSCMKKMDEKVFQPYIENPEVCRMLVLLEDEKLIGRALIWKIDSIKTYNDIEFKSEYFMDRQYTIEEHDVEKFRNYAIERGWIFKTNNNHHSMSEVTYNGSTYNVEMTVQLKPISYGYFPYMDTFRRYDPQSDKLFNDEEESLEYAEQYILDDTDGGWREIHSGCWSDYHDRIVSEHDAVWSDYEQSYLDSEDHNVIAIYGYGWFTKSSEVIEYDGWDEEFIHIDDSIYSEIYEYSIKMKYSVNAINEIDDDGNPEYPFDNVYHTDDSNILYVGEVDKSYWHQRLKDKYNDWENCSYIHTSLLTKNSYGNYILKKFKIELYKVISEDDDYEYSDYLDKFTSKALGIEIDENEKIVIDKFDYYKGLNNLEAIVDKLRKKDQSIKSSFDKESLGQKSEFYTEYGEIVKEIESGLFIDYVEED